MATEYLPHPLDATAEEPALFDGTTRLHFHFLKFFHENLVELQGLQDKIKLVPLNLQNKPAWYKEKVYSANKVPSLEHNGKVMGESIDLIKYVDTNFEGPSLLPNVTSLELFSALSGGTAFDHLEHALTKYDGPFLLGHEFSLEDITFIPLVERFQINLSEVFKYAFRAGRPKVTAWIEAVNKIDAYKQTKKADPKEIVARYKMMFSAKK
ncbi:hypothetical protein V6N12_017241 [Hibiscus sabdariffa]|uniref:GST C-terminal domain-containing protein n=1 Tax=Hibiscus sabdariffa TaxID=183260 RepID=A0ABR2CFP1_9ROSI